MSYIFPVEVLPQLLLKDVVKKMPSSAAVRFYCSGRLGKWMVGKTRGGDLEFCTGEHDENLWTGCACEKEALIRCTFYENKWHGVYLLRFQFFRFWGMVNHSWRLEDGLSRKITQELNFKLARLADWERRYSSKGVHDTCSRCREDAQNLGEK